MKVSNAIIPVLITLGGLTVLSACSVATASINPKDQRTFVGSLSDVNAGRAIEARMKRAYDYSLRKVDVEVAERVVLLSGTVPTQEDRIEAAKIAWSAPGVIQVGNEIIVGERQGLIRNTQDGLLEKSVRSRLLVDRYVRATNFNIETHEGVVYILGVARTPHELDRAARIAAHTRGAREVISYVRVVDKPQAPETYQATAEIDPGSSPYRQLPDFVTQAPLPEQDGTALAAPTYRPLESNGYSPRSRDDFYYIDPHTGQKIDIRTQMRSGD